MRLIENDSVFNVIVDSSLQQKFIEQEKTMMLDFLQRKYHNRMVMFNFIIEEGEKEDVPLHFQLNGKQKFERIAEQYPLVKELRDRLKLDIAF
jgi:DNA polymerase-3 subunit gamma/tau